jgi:ankyrin repeat protein
MSRPANIASKARKMRKNNNPSLLLTSFMLLGISSLASCKNCQNNNNNNNNTNSTQSAESATSSQHQPVAGPEPSPPLPPLTITTEMIQAVESEGAATYYYLVQVLEKLKDNQPVKINEKDFKGTTALNYAVNLKDGAKVVQVLLDKEASLVIADSAGWLPLYSAVVHGNIETTKVLIAAMKAKKLSLNAKNDVNSPTAYKKAKELYILNDPTTKAYKDIMDLLKNAGADITL